MTKSIELQLILNEHPELFETALQLVMNQAKVCGVSTDKEDQTA